MALYVLKFGGSSIANLERMSHVADIISQLIGSGNKIVVVTSAMQGVTNNLVSNARQITFDIDREYDAIISSGELVAAGMLARTLQTTGIPAVSLSAFQVPIYATGNYGNGKITHIGTSKIIDFLNRGIVPVITGFQGITQDNTVITLGRGGSDATACALAHFLNADECFIYTDVEGVFTADPRIALNVQLIPKISYEEMLELSFWGAKVLQYQSVEIAKRYNVTVRVLSSFTNSPGTVICAKTEQPIFGISYSTSYNLVSTNIDNEQFIKVGHNLYLVPKDLVPKDLVPKDTEIEGNIDMSIGTVTVIGCKIDISNIVVPRYKVERKLSTTYIIPRTQIETTVNNILDAITIK